MSVRDDHPGLGHIEVNDSDYRTVHLPCEPFPEPDQDGVKELAVAVNV